MHVMSFMLLKAEIISVYKIVFIICPECQLLLSLHILWVLQSALHLSATQTPFRHVILILD